jgi:hypothetical protein
MRRSWHVSVRLALFAVALCALPSAAGATCFRVNAKTDKPECFSIPKKERKGKHRKDRLFGVNFLGTAKYTLDEVQ